MLPERVILSHPFSGSLYAFFSDELGAGHTQSESSYYRTLFGKDYRKLTDLALTLTVIYKTLVIPPVDIPLPDYEKWQTDYGYENKDLGILYHHPRERGWYGEIDSLIETDMNDAVVQRILHNVPKHSWFQILRDARYEIKLAYVFECPVLCSQGRRALIQRLLESDYESGRIDIVNSSVVAAVEEYVDIAGLVFNPRNIQGLYDLKTDNDLRQYANSFASTIHEFHNEPNVRRRLLELMRDSIGKSAIARSTVGFLDASSTILGFVGLLPVLGTISTIGGIATSGTSYGAKKYQQKHEWYQLAPRILETLTLKQIEKRIETELDGSEGA